MRENGGCHNFHQQGKVILSCRLCEQRREKACHLFGGNYARQKYVARGARARVSPSAKTRHKMLSARFFPGDIPWLAILPFENPHITLLFFIIVCLSHLDRQAPPPTVADPVRGQTIDETEKLAKRDVTPPFSVAHAGAAPSHHRWWKSRHYST